VAWKLINKKNVLRGTACGAMLVFLVGTAVGESLRVNNNWRYVSEPGYISLPDSLVAGVLLAQTDSTTSSPPADEPADEEPDSLDDLFQIDSVEEDASPEDSQADAEDPLAGESLFDLSDEKKPKVWGFYQLEYAYTSPSPGHTSKVRNFLEVGTDGRFSDSVSWRLSGRGTYDAVFALTDFYSDRVKDDRELDGMLYETYADISSGNWDFRLGRQNIN